MRIREKKDHLARQVRDWFEGNPSPFDRVRFRYATSLKVLGVAALVALLGWLTGLWSALCALIGEAVRLFAVIRGTSFDNADPAASTEAFRNLLWGVSALGGAVVAVLGLVLAAWRTFTQWRSAEIENRRVETETFSKAMEQLARYNFAVRLGAIQSLESLAWESPRLHEPIMEAFCAYVRQKRSGDEEKFAERATLQQLQKGSKKFDPLPQDIQAIMTAIGRRRRLHETERFRLDLRGSDLTGADLRQANLSNAIMVGACLDGAWLNEACFDDANLIRVYMRKAMLGGASFKEAKLPDAHLQHVVLVNPLSVDFEGAAMVGCQLQNAALANANLRSVRFDRAVLSGTLLYHADLTDSNIEQEQLDAAEGNQETRIPDGLERPSHWVHSP